MNTILVVDDHVLFREGMCNIIRRWDDFEVVGEAANGLEAVEKARELLPDIVLMDISMPKMTGIEATLRLKRELPSVRVVILTMSEEDDDLFHAVKNGARGYVLKDTPSKRLHDQLRGVMRDESPLSGVMAAKILGEYGRSEYGHGENLGGEASHSSETQTRIILEATDRLSEREIEVLQRVAQGMTNLEIAQSLFLSENTIKKYLSNILDKLQVNNRVEAAMKAVSEGLIKK